MNIFFALNFFFPVLVNAEPIDLLPKGKSAIKCESDLDLDTAVTKLNDKLLEDKISIRGIGGGEYFVKKPYQTSAPLITEKTMNGTKQFVACVTVSKN